MSPREFDFRVLQNWRIWIAAFGALLIAAVFLMPRGARNAALESLRDKVVATKRLVEGPPGTEVGQAPIATPSTASPAFASNRGVLTTSASVSDSNSANANSDSAVPVAPGLYDRD